MQSKSANTSSVQFEMLVNYMLKHPDLSKGYIKTPEARKKSAYLWTNLSKDLNAEGPPQRDGNGWKKVWADFKVHTKAKLRKNKTNLSGTGGGPPKYFHLTPLEEKVVELLDMGKAIDGLDSTNCFGMNKDKDEERLINPQDAVVEEALQTILNDIEENVNDPITEENEQRLPRKVKPSLLETQVKTQIAFHNNAHEVLKEINDGIKGMLRYKRKDFELKEKIYKLKKENFRFKKEKFDFKRENAIQKLKTNIAKLELKKEIIRLRQECENKQ